MGMLDKITSGTSPQPPRIILYGEEGIGKSTLAAQFPRPIFIQTENGLGQINCAKFPLCQTYDDALDCIKAIANEDNKYFTLVIDSLDWLEKLIHERIPDHPENKYRKEVADLEFGRGYTWAMDYWQQIFDQLDAVAKFRNVVLIAHAKPETVKDPERGAYNVISPAIQGLPQKKFVEWADAILYAHVPISLDQVKVGMSGTMPVAQTKKVAGGGIVRQLRCIRGAAVRAKNRYSMPEILTLEWPTLKPYLAGLVDVKE